MGEGGLIGDRRSATGGPGLDDICIGASVVGVRGGAEPEHDDVVAGGKAEGVLAGLLGEDVASVVHGDKLIVCGCVTVDVVGVGEAETSGHASDLGVHGFKGGGVKGAVIGRVVGLLSTVGVLIGKDAVCKALVTAGDVCSWWQLGTLR